MSTHNSEYADQGPKIIAVTLVLFVSATIPVVLRLYLRLSTKPRTYGADDTLIVGAWIMMLLWVACALQAVRFGAGRHTATLTSAQLSAAIEPRYFGNLAFTLCSGLVKCSLVVQALRIFTGKRTRLALWILLGLIVAYTLACLVASIFVCKPISAFWSVDLFSLWPDSYSRCLNFATLYYTYSALNLFTDVAVLVVPLPALLRLNLPGRTKVAACTLISLGSFGCIASAVRFYELWWVLTFSKDSTWDQGNNMWSTVELTVFVTCAAVTGLKPLFDRTLRPLLRSCLGSKIMGSARDARGSGPTDSGGSSVGRGTPWAMSNSSGQIGRYDEIAGEQDRGSCPPTSDRAVRLKDPWRFIELGDGARSLVDEEKGVDEAAIVGPEGQQQDNRRSLRQSCWVIQLTDMGRRLSWADLAVNAGSTAAEEPRRSSEARESLR